jgi:hypothetical protein
MCAAPMGNALAFNRHCSIVAAGDNLIAPEADVHSLYVIWFF